MNRTSNGLHLLLSSCQECFNDLFCDPIRSNGPIKGRNFTSGQDDGCSLIHQHEGVHVRKNRTIDFDEKICYPLILNDGDPQFLPVLLQRESSIQRIDGEE